MDNNKLFEKLLKADGIEPSGVSEAERAVFREMLEREQKHFAGLSWRTNAMIGIWTIALLGLCFFGDSLKRVGIPFVVSFLVVVASAWVVIIRYLPRHNRKLKESNKKISKLYYLVHGKHRGFAIVGKKNGKRVIHWPSLIILTIGLWLFCSLGIAGVFYLLCQRWMYSSSPIFYIFYSTLIPLSFVITLLIGGLKAPLDELVEVKAKPSKPGSRLGIWRIIMKAKITKFAVAAAVGIAALIGINQLGGSIDGNSVAWASIAEQFKSVPFFKATIYLKEDALDRPVQIEIWRNRRGLARLRYGSQIAFAQDGKVIRAFDLKTRSETEPSDMFADILGKLGTDDFSLETVIRAISGGKLVDVTPLVNAQASISEDIVVFDIEHESSPQWFRIWAMRESRLPTYIRMWDPRDGECSDAILTYSKEPNDKFFDPNAFSKEMKKTGNKEINLAYMFLQDPGGKQILPRKIDEHQALKVVTKTIDGQDFSLADYKGKTVLLAFWDNRYYHPELSLLKNLYRRFGKREDFVIVGVSLRKDAESSRKICKEKRIDWLQLHEPDAGYKNRLAKALGVVDLRNLWLLCKDGKIEKLQDMDFATGKVEASVIGFTCESKMWIEMKLSERHASQGALSTEDIIEICGDSYTIEDSPDVPGRKRMVYEAYNKDKSRIAILRAEIEDKTVMRWDSKTLVDQATVTFSFTSEFIKNRIESQVAPDILEKMYKDYKVLIYACKGSWRYRLIFSSIEPDKSYQRRLPPGTYDFVIDIGPTNERGSIIKIIKQIVLCKNVQLNKNENKTIRFE